MRYDTIVINRGDCTPGGRHLTARKDGNMQINRVHKFDLRLFDGAAGGGDGAGGGGEGSAANTGATEADAAPQIPNRRRKADPYANVKFGKAQNAQAQGQDNTPPDQPDPEAEWKIVKEKYRELFNRETSAIVQERLKNSKQAEETLSKLSPILDGLGKKYGKQADDIDGILAAYTDDDALYEDDAAKAGIPVSVYKQMEHLKADKAAREAKDAQTLQEQQYQRHIQGMIADFDKNVKSVFPAADLRAELQNQEFRRLTSPEVGVSTRDAYWLVHRAEIQSQTMQVAAQKAQQKLSQSVQSGRSRPDENGTRNVSTPLDIRDDPAKWSKADRAEVKRRVMRGERINL